MYNSQVSGSINLLPLVSLLKYCIASIPNKTTIRIIGNFFDVKSTDCFESFVFLHFVNELVSEIDVEPSLSSQVNLDKYIKIFEKVQNQVDNRATFNCVNE